MKYSALLCVFLMGMIDQVNGDIASVEITDESTGLVYTSMHTALFPCKVSEGDFFYFEHVDGVTEIRCGEPPE